MTSVVYVFGSLLNFLVPDAFEIALEAAAIGVQHDIKGEAIVVVCVLRPGETDEDGLRNAIAATVATDGHSRVNPSLNFNPTAQPTSNKPATIR